MMKKTLFLAALVFVGLQALAASIDLKTAQSLATNASSG